MGKLINRKFNGVYNANIKKLGEMRFTTNKAFDSVGTVNDFKIIATEEEVYNIVEGSGTFVDPTATNNGKTLTVGANSAKFLGTTKAGDVISVSNKYAVKEIDFKNQNAIIDVEELTYSAALANLIGSNSFHGDIKAFANKGNIGLIQDNNAVNLEGDFSVFANNQSLAYFMVSSNTKIHGLVADIASIPNLVVFRCLGNFSGDISLLSNLSTIDIAGNLTGDISGLNSSLNRLQSNRDSVFSWATDSSRPVDATIPRMIDINLGDDIDKALINLANCTGTTVDTKSLVLYGNRTSASDAAVATIKGKGYSVSVNGVSL